MGQTPSKDKLRRTSSERIERIPKNEKYRSLKKGSIKKKDVQQVTQVLTAAKLSPKLPQQTTVTEAKRRPPSVTEPKTVRKGIFSVKEKKSTVSKDYSEKPLPNWMDNH